MDSMNFMYDSLTAYKDHIRLIRLLSGKSRTPVCCELYTKSLKDVHSSYDAFSYVWGPETPSRKIFVNEKPFWIRKNLWRFLKTVRLKTGNLTIWADAICIDQSNLQERAQQVQIMGDIYRAARKVCAWLGEDAGQIGSIARIWNQDCLSHTLDVEDELLQKFCSRLDGGREFVSEALHQLLFNEYWTRVWIIPEIVLGGHVDVWCRWKSVWEEWECEVIQFPALVRMYLLLGRYFDVKAEGIFTASAKVVDLLFCKQALIGGTHCRREASKLLDLGSLLIQFGLSQCADVRDRVYSLAGLTLPWRASTIREAQKGSGTPSYHEVMCSIIGDYSISCRELFLRILKVDRPRFVAELAEPLWFALGLQEKCLSGPAEFANDRFTVKVIRYRKIWRVKDGYAHVVGSVHKMRLGAFDHPIRGGDLLLTFSQNLSIRDKDAFSSNEKRGFCLQNELFLVMRLISRQQGNYNLAGRRQRSVRGFKAVGVAVGHELPQPGYAEQSANMNYLTLELATRLFRDTTLKQASRPNSPKGLYFYATIPLPAMLLLEFGPSGDWHWHDRRRAFSRLLQRVRARSIITNCQPDAKTWVISYQPLNRTE